MSLDEIRIFIADDHPVYREGLRRILEAHPMLEVIGEADDGLEALSAIRMCSPDVALLDLNLPGLDGIEILDELSKASIPIRGVIISAFEDAATVYRAFTTGASAYILKTSTPDAICDILLRVAEGAVVIPPELQTGFANEVRRSHRTRESTCLTERELDVLRLAAEGLSNRDIAAELFVGVTTVKTHMHHIYDKFGVKVKRPRFDAASF